MKLNGNYIKNLSQKKVFQLFVQQKKQKMTRIIIAGGVLHEVPEDIKKSLKSDTNIISHWNNLTPIQRNEWICWITIVKKSETRAAHIERMLEELVVGKRTPCCWPGCPHRRPSAQKWFKKKDLKKMTEQEKCKLNRKINYSESLEN